MTCPRCGNEWDVSKSPCSRCGLLVRLPGRLGSQQQDPNSVPRAPKSSSQPDTMSPVTQSQNTGGARPIVNRPNPASPLSAPRIQRETSGVFDTVNVANPAQPRPFPQDRTSGDINPLTRPNPTNDANPLTRPNTFGERSFPNLPPAPEREDGPPNSVQIDFERWSAQNRSRSGLSSPDHSIPKSVPSRPQISMNREQASSDAQRQQPHLRPSRLVTEPSRVESPRARADQSQLLAIPFQGEINSLSPSVPQPYSPVQLQGSQTSPPLQAQNAQSTQTAQNAQNSIKDLRLLIPGTLLRSGRYRLRELKSRQEWQGGVYESIWGAQDAQRSGSEVTICELVTPESGSMMIQSFLRTATMALTSIGRHPRVPTLWDAFGDQGRNFFVFEPIEGESLLAYMQRTGRAVPEQDVIECCLQMTEILELLSMQSPPLVHGLIRPEHIVKARQNGEYVLTDFSVVLAGGATQFISGIDRTRLSPYMAPEFSRNSLDARLDIYSLLASMYHAVTGSIPAVLGSSDIIPQAQQLNPNVSLQFNAILARGLRPNSNQRYQRPAELRQELLSLRARAQSFSNSASYSQRSGPLAQDQSQSMQPSTFPSASSTSDDLAHILPNMLSTINTDDEQDQRLLLPRPEELPPLKAGNDNRQATLWLAGILLCLIIVVLLSRGLT